MERYALGVVMAVLAAMPLRSQFTLQQAMSAPFSNQLTAAPARARVAWFTDSEGRRNVWVAGTHETAHAVTHNTADDGQDIDDIIWSRDAERLAWTRGTGAAGSEHTLAANPAELPGPVEQHIEWANLRGGPVHMGPEGHSPLFLPDGRHLLYLRHGSVWVADLDAGGTKHTTGRGPQRGDLQASGTNKQNVAAKPDASGAVVDATAAVKNQKGTQQLLFLRGTAHGLRLSPDGAQLALVSDRGDHSFVAVYTFAMHTLQWIDPGTYLDHDPVWSPDGKQIALVREVPIVSPIADRWMRDGQPWSIRVADVSTGRGRELWRAGPGAGSLFHEVSAKNQLLWMPNGAIVFPWEAGGWTRLYRVGTASSGTEPVLLTPGSFEVDGVAAPNGTGMVLLFSANRVVADSTDVDRHHVWAVNLADHDRLQSRTDGTGIETEPALLSDNAEAAMAGGAQEPLVPVLLEHGRARPFAPQLVPATFPAAQFVTPQQVVFPAADGMQIHGQLFLPHDAPPKAKLPAVVFFHGGSRRQMLLGFHPMQYYAQAYEFNQYLASLGFAVLSVNYRSGVGYGLDFRQALNYGANGGSEDLDVVGAAKYLQSRADVDPNRIGAWGGSYGGYLTALALARHSDLYKAGVDLHGVHDWALELDLSRPTDEPGVDEAAVSRRAFESSPMATLDGWKSPVLLIQGDDDRNVLFAQTVRLANDLRGRGVHVEELVFPDEVHDFLLHRDWLAAYAAAADFLQRELKARPAQ